MTTFPHQEIDLHLSDKALSKRRNAGKYEQNHAQNKIVTNHCTKNRQGLVNRLHSVDFRGDKDAHFSLTIKIEGVKTISFFDTFPSFSGWCSVPGLKRDHSYTLQNE